MSERSDLPDLPKRPPLGSRPIELAALERNLATLRTHYDRLRRLQRFEPLDRELLANSINHANKLVKLAHAQLQLIEHGRHRGTQQ